MSARSDTPRPSPDALLRVAAQEGRGRLKLFLGAAPGVGKTYEMLSEGQARRRDGSDVVIAVVETHGRAETEALTRDLPVIPKKSIDYQGRTLAELDLDAVLARRPALALVDELAHTNAPGCRHPKRWQDVEELLAAGIDVYSTLNVQHIESLNDVVASFTKVRVRETVPDRIVEQAEIELVDIPPDELIERLKAGKVYVPAEATRALSHFFSKSNLSALRELALRRAAQAVDAQMLDYVRAHALAGNWAAGERIVVAVSELPGAGALIRAAKRLADAQRAPWSAVYVETPRSLGFSDADRQRLSDNLQLATQLGATVGSIAASRVVDGLQSFMAEVRATQLVVGKSARSRWFELRHGSVVDRLVRETPGVAVHVLPMDGEGDTATARASRKRSPTSWGSPLSYLLSLLLVALFTGVAIAADAFGGLTNVALVYLVPVLAAASWYGWKTGVFTGLCSALAYNFFFLPPRYTFTIQDPENVLTLVVFIGVAVVTSQLAARVRVEADIAARSSGRNAALASFARTLAGLTTPQELGQTLCGEVARQFDVNTIFLRRGRSALEVVAAVPPDASLGTIDEAAAEWALDHGEPTGRASGTLAAAEWLFYPLRSGGRALGVVGIARGDGADPVRADQTPFLLSFIDQAGLAQERIGLAEEMAAVAQLRERDRLRGALLSSVSHDLRTPLTTIIAALDALKKQGRSDLALLSEIESQSERLSRFVGNLLDMVRVEAGGLRLKLAPVDLTEAVAGAADDLRPELASHPLRVTIPPDLPLVRVDPQLLHQCLVNLLENAAKFSAAEAPIGIVAEREPGAVRLAVVDAGTGLAPGDEQRVFETFVRLEGSDRKGGTGLGLAIVKGFAGAMGIEVSARNNADAPGARFTLRFPDATLVRMSDGAA
ncbi:MULTISPECIES: sensor histidine kinase [Sphingomonas]|uniref:sensor histidine kinase n=1 Tax=Sphingomonas TaxID=13687 RepID=UPI000DEEB2E6|nr:MULTISPECIES: sensor histidine kinase KdpD [Sphingomonas]